jgi:hypothetical protein
VLADLEGVLCKSFEKQVLDRICMVFKGVLAKVCNLIFNLVSPVRPLQLTQGAVAAGGTQPAQQSGGMGSPHGKAEGWTARHLPMGSRWLGSTSSPAGVLSPGCAQLSGTGWEHGEGGGGQPAARLEAQRGTRRL